ncbi:MAG: pyridoxal phosphate-dependent aminotransferase [Acidobacteriales bacterium]|nr:pyridoxal phosphate-dependent aminotransferase [Terriglobales bacterium]
MATTVASPFSDRVQRIESSPTLLMTAEAAKMRAQGIHLTDLGAGEPFFNTPDHIKRAGIEAIEKNFTRYTGAAGIPDLRRAIAERHRADWQSDYSPEETIFTPGGKYGLFLALQTLVQKGDEVVVAVPYWVSFPDMVRYAGGKCVFVETEEAEGFQLHAAHVIDAITPRTRVIILNSPNNPTGAVIAPREYEEIVMAAHKRGIFVINDECYVHLNYAPAEQRISAGRFKAAKDHMVLVGSLSKAYCMTGWRAGFALGPKPVIEQMVKLQSQSTSSICAITQKAAVAALTGPQEFIAEMRDTYRQLRDECVAGLNALPHVHCAMPGGAFYAFPNVSHYLGKNGIRSNTDIVQRLLREAHVVTNAGDTFGSREHIRLSYAVDQKTLQEALKRMRAWFEQQL